MKKRDDVTEEMKRALDESLPEDFVAASLARTLGEARRKRRRRQGVTVACVAGVSALGILAWIQSGTTAVPVMAGAQPEKVMEGSPPIRIEEISDAELLALFPGRAAGFATVNGRREFTPASAGRD